MRTSHKNALQLWQIPRPKRTRKTPPPPHLYSRDHMPVVDVHMHIRSRPTDAVTAASAYLAIMDQNGISVSVNLSGGKDIVAQAEQITKATQGRILVCPATYFNKNIKEFWWSIKDLDDFSQQENIAGMKIWCKYERPLLKKSIDKKLRKQAELGIPAIGLHISDPPVRNFWKPEYWQCISDAERVIRKYPNLNFIMAHGFWLMTNDEGLDVLGQYFDAYPNLHVDLSAVDTWWDGPDLTYKKLRAFIIAYKDRILFGSDGNPQYTRPHHFAQTFAILESKKKNLAPFFGEADKVWHIQGLHLPVTVLNYIYYWNAARLVPNIRRSLLNLGYVA